MRRTWVGVVLAALVVTASSGCGVPATGEPTRVSPSDVPYGLLTSPTPTAAAPTRPVTGLEVSFVVDGDRLTTAPVDTPSEGDGLASALSALVRGPDSTLRDRGVGTAIPPGMTLRVVGLLNRIATIDLSGDPPDLMGAQGQLAVGQIVLTATSAAPVDAVQLTQDGQPIEAQLPGGQLTGAPLSAADYRGLLGPSPSP